MRTRTCTRTWRTFGALVAGLALLAAGCGDDDDDGAVATTEEPGGEAGGPVEVTGVDFAFEGLPEEIPGGLFAFTFTNAGEVAHEIAFVEIGDTPIDQFFPDFLPVIEEGGAFPEYTEDIVGANEAEPGQSTDLVYTIPEGTYAVFCALTGTVEDPESEEGPPHFEEGMQQVVTVGAAEGDAELPEADGTITASDYTFDADLSGGDTVINFVNDGPDQVHFAGFDVFPEGTSVEDAEAAFGTLVASEEGEEPPAGTPQPEEIGFSGVASDGEGIQFEVPGGFEAGRTYIFYCFIPDRTGGPPHAIAYQMYKAFTVE